MGVRCCACVVVDGGASAVNENTCRAADDGEKSHKLRNCDATFQEYENRTAATSSTGRRTRYKNGRLFADGMDLCVGIGRR